MFNFQFLYLSQTADRHLQDLHQLEDYTLNSPGLEHVQDISLTTNFTDFLKSTHCFHEASWMCGGPRSFASFKTLHCFF